MSEVAVLDIKGKQVDKVDCPDDLFGKYINTAVLHQAIVMYQASLRQGNASTKERAYVSGGGKKPHRQKGTGRARAGSSRSPLWHGGGVTFGPHPRDFDYPLPKKIKKAALREGLNAKLKDEKLICFEDITAEIAKTKEVADFLKSLNVAGKTLLVLDGSHETFGRAARNIMGINIVRAQDVNAYDVLRNKFVLVSRSGLNKLLDRVKK